MKNQPLGRKGAQLDPVDDFAHASGTRDRLKEIMPHLWAGDVAAERDDSIVNINGEEV